MAYEQRDNSGSLFKNEEKQTERHPDYSGTLLIAGQAYFLDAWVKTAKTGKKYMSLSAKPKMARQTAGALAHKEPEPEFDDKIPF